MEERKGNLYRLLQSFDAGRELSDVLKDIEREAFPTPERAIQLGFLYTVWDFRVDLFNNLGMRNVAFSAEDFRVAGIPQIEATNLAGDVNQLISDPKTLEEAQQRREKLLVTLQQAEKGDYTGIRQHMEENANACFRDAKELFQKSPDSPKGDFRMITGQAFKRVADLIPEQGSPLQPPPIL